MIDIYANMQIMTLPSATMYPDQRNSLLGLSHTKKIYRANRLVNWCCHLRTAISNIEVRAAFIGLGLCFVVAALLPLLFSFPSPAFHARKLMTIIPDATSI